MLKNRKNRIKWYFYVIYAGGLPLLLTVIGIILDSIDSVPDFLKPGFGVETIFLKGNGQMNRIYNQQHLAVFACASFGSSVTMQFSCFHVVNFFCVCFLFLFSHNTHIESNHTTKYIYLIAPIFIVFSSNIVFFILTVSNILQHDQQLTTNFTSSSRYRKQKHE